ncbi:MAG: nucleoside triphosphate pyrophosphohydrolase [Dongiaceae bacterium]
MIKLKKPKSSKPKPKSRASSPKLGKEPLGRNMYELYGLMAALRDPKTGCAWDLEQSFETIVPYTLEEAYEVADTVRRGDYKHLAQELGDLLLQIVFLARIAEEKKLFDLNDVIKAICFKLKDRHPHIFAKSLNLTASQVNKLWEERKTKERSAKGHQSALDDVPQSLPALIRAYKIQRRAADQGFDWPDIEGPFKSFYSEISELKHEIKHKNKDNIKDEMGDLFFALINIARHLKIDPEEALAQTNLKFERRFRGIENELKKRKKSMRDQSLKELDRLWDKEKKKKSA